MCVVGRRLDEVSPGGLGRDRVVLGASPQGLCGENGPVLHRDVIEDEARRVEDHVAIRNEGGLDQVEREDQITLKLGLDNNSG